MKLELVTPEEAKELAGWTLDDCGYDPLDARHRVATLLIAGVELVHTVENLVAFTGYARPFVEAVHRRFVESDVWPTEYLTRAMWVDPFERRFTGEYFVADVNVGLGRSRRRTGEGMAPEYVPENRGVAPGERRFPAWW